MTTTSTNVPQLEPIVVDVREREGWFTAEVREKSSIYSSFFMTWHNLYEMWEDMPRAFQALAKEAGWKLPVDVQVVLHCGWPQELPNQAQPTSAPAGADLSAFQKAASHLAYTVFLHIKQGKNPDDGGPNDWFTDTQPRVQEWFKQACLHEGVELINLTPSPALPNAMAEPVAARYGWDGYGYQYIDGGSGSDWKTRHPDAEFLYETPSPVVPSAPSMQAEDEKWCVHVYGPDDIYPMESKEAALKEANDINAALLASGHVQDVLCIAVAELDVDAKATSPEAPTAPTGSMGGAV